MLGLGLSLTTGGVATPAYVALAKAFVTRVEADGGTVESFACLKTDMAYLTSNPAAPAGYTAEWSAATVGSSAEFRINLVGGAGYTYTYAVTDSQATEVTGTGVMGGNIQAVTADLSTLVDGTVTLAVYLTGAGGDGLVVTDTATLVGYTGLLDTYSGAAAAYSLRLLDTSYTGDAIVVRRASDNTTQNIGFVNNELDTATLESFCSGTDGFVTTWYDQSGNANNATQATASAQPKIVSAGSTILENGKAALEFDGNNDYIVATGTFSISSDLTSALVYKSNAGNAGTQIEDGVLYQYNINLSDYFAHGLRDGGLFSRLLINNSLTEGNGYDFSSTSNFLSFDYFDYSASTNNLYVDNVSGTDVNAGRSLGSSTSAIWLGSRANGDRFFVDGRLSEIVFYESDQSTNRSGIQTNINDFYSIY